MNHSQQKLQPDQPENPQFGSPQLDQPDQHISELHPEKPINERADHPLTQQQ